MKTPLIAFTGLAGSGKSSLAYWLVAHKDFVRLSFAAPIRAMLGALGVTPEQMAAGKNAPLPLLGGKTPREAMQTLGTEWGRGLVSPDLWTNAAREAVTSARNRPGVGGVVLDDCRFDNEASLVLGMGGVVLEIRRPGVTRMDHDSEAGVSGHLIDRWVENDFTSIWGLEESAPRLFRDAGIFS